MHVLYIINFHIFTCLGGHSTIGPLGGEIARLIRLWMLLIYSVIDSLFVLPVSVSLWHSETVRCANTQKTVYIHTNFWYKKDTIL